jgi:Smg protein
MKEDMFEVLLYLFETHMQGDCKVALTEDYLMTELERVGFDSASIDNALEWLEGLLVLQENTLPPVCTGSIRVYHLYEMHRLSTDVRGFLLFLRQAAILNTFTQELVINRLLAIDQEEEITLAEVKWVTLLVLFNQPDEEEALACMENLVLENTSYGLH